MIISTHCALWSIDTMNMDNKNYPKYGRDRVCVTHAVWRKFIKHMYLHEFAKRSGKIVKLLVTNSALPGLSTALISLPNTPEDIFYSNGGISHLSRLVL